MYVSLSLTGMAHGRLPGVKISVWRGRSLVRWSLLPFHAMCAVITFKMCRRKISQHSFLKHWNLLYDWWVCHIVAMYNNLHPLLCSISSEWRSGAGHAVLQCLVFKQGSLRWRNWFTEIGQTITVTGQIHSCLYYYQRSTSKHPVFFYCLEHTCMHTCTCTHIHLPPAIHNQTF